jgi:hypothetical protein
MKFINVTGYQWDENMKKERGERPCYEFNKLRVTAKRIINEMRSNRPSGKVRPVEGGDKETAETIEGLVRNIWNTSNGDSVIDYAAEYQVGAGMGAWRIVTDYADDHMFAQDIQIEQVENPFCLFCDPSARKTNQTDARDWLFTERITKEEYKERWPNAKVVDFEDHEFDDDDEWETEDNEVRIGEYWYKEPIKLELWQLEDGKVIDASEEA